ncbi:MAG: FecR domain-containing protein [Clostridiales bacterium]|nr:FecR domain-containing protein [Clostridiales bacterium]
MKKKLLSAIVSFIILFSCILPLNAYASEETGYWERTNIFDREVDISKVEKSEDYSPTWEYHRGYYTYRCEVTFEGIWYSGKDHDKCNGEYVESTGRVATPEICYLGGEEVVLHTSIYAVTSSKICFHLGANVGSFITTVNQDDPFVVYGTETSLYDITGTYTRSFLESYKNDTNTGYEGMSADMGATMPEGSSEGDKVFIVTGLGGGNESMQTAYEYTWHTTGGENAVAMREEYNAKLEEERILEAWKNRQKEKDKLHKLDPNYVDSNLRVEDIWGEVWIIRKDKQYEDEWEDLSPNSRIYFGDTIRTHRDSGVVISKTNFITFSIRENTQITLPDEPEAPSAMKIWGGNIWVNIEKMIHGGEFNIETKQAVAGIKGTTFAIEEKEDASIIYLFTSSMDVTSKATGEKVVLKPGESAEVDNNGVITVKAFDIPTVAKQMVLPIEILEEDGYSQSGMDESSSPSWILPVIILLVAVVIIAIIIVLLNRKKQRIG